MPSSIKRGVFHSENISIFLCELFGTAILVFFSCSIGIKWDTHSQLDSLRIFLTLGFAILICIQCFGCVSGAHVNPCVTVAALIYNMISIQMAVNYVIAQLLGAFIGYGLLIILIPPTILEQSGPSLGVLKPMELVTIPQALCIEFIATGILIWFCCGIWDPRNAKHQDSVPLRFAFAVAGLTSATANFSGGSMNPARSTGPALWTGDYELLWIYWVAPLSAATVFATIYKYVFRREVIEAENYALQNVCDGSEKDCGQID